jgi:hypothetical protein
MGFEIGASSLHVAIVSSLETLALAARASWLPIYKRAGLAWSLVVGAVEVVDGSLAADSTIDRTRIVQTAAEPGDAGVVGVDTQVGK